MGISPDTSNYCLGKGVLYFDQLVGAVYTGERDLGNATDFSFNVSVDKLEHFSSRGGLKAKDKSVISQVTPGIKFTLDEINKENLAMLSLGTISEVTQSAGSVVAESLNAYVGKRLVLAHRSIGTYTIAHGTVTNGPFVVGQTIAASGASTGAGNIAAVGSGTIQIAITSGTFASGCTLTSQTTKTATSSAAPVWLAGVLLVQDSADTVTYAAGTDYIIDTTLNDDKIGRILIPTGSTITDASDVHVTYGYAAATYTKVAAFTQTIVEGRLRFVSDNPVGENQEVVVWRVSLSPDGDTSFIGDNWSTLGFTGEVLKDETGHPTSPYMDFIFG